MTCAITALKKKNIIPGLAVILIGHNPSSLIYVEAKKKKAQQLGVQFFFHHVDETTPHRDVLHLIQSLNEDIHVHGILLQLPIKRTNDEVFALLNHIAPIKDVDGLTPYNQGLVLQGEGSGIVPCTPKGCMELITSVGRDVRGANAVVIGRSILVGKPMALLLTNHHATVTIAHSQTRDLKSICRRSDIIVSCVGHAKFLDQTYFKQDSIVIDVGITRTKDGIVGDVDFENVRPVVHAITPVPGGVGPMTIASLFHNLLIALYKQTCPPS